MSNYEKVTREFQKFAELVREVQNNARELDPELVQTAAGIGAMCYLVEDWIKPGSQREFKLNRKNTLYALNSVRQKTHKLLDEWVEARGLELERGSNAIHIYFRRHIEILYQEAARIIKMPKTDKKAKTQRKQATSSRDWFAGITNAQELKKFYRQLCKQWHPDICRDPRATEYMQQINAQYTAKCRMYC